MAACLSVILDASDAQVMGGEPQQVMRGEPHNLLTGAHALSPAAASPEQPGTSLGSFSSEEPSSPGLEQPSSAGRTSVEQLVNAQGAPRRWPTRVYPGEQNEALLSGFVWLRGTCSPLSGLHLFKRGLLCSPG